MSGVSGESSSVSGREEKQRAFRQAFAEKQPAIVDKLVAATLAALPFSAAGGDAGLRSALEKSVDSWLAAAEGPGLEMFARQIDGWCATFRKQNADPAIVLQLLETTARTLIDATLDALDEGVVGATETAQGLLGALAAANLAYDQGFREVDQALAEKALILRAVAENAPDAIGIAAEAGTVQYVNRAFVKLVGREAKKDDMLFDYLHPDDVPKILEMSATALVSGGKSEGTLRYLRPDGTIVRAHVSAFRVLGYDGQTIARCGLIRDLTDDEQKDEERRALEDRILSIQAEALREIAAPIMPLAEGVIAMPLVGTIDVARAERILQVMLDGILQTGAGHVIIDITGVPVVDAEVADAIARASKAAQLVGTEVVITGIRGAVAQTIVELGVDLGGVDTWSTLRQGVAHAIHHERSKKAQQTKAQQTKAKGRSGR